jgi:hypothetical protein
MPEQWQYRLPRGLGHFLRSLLNLDLLGNGKHCGAPFG